ncbi:mycofactocin biosynthesis peptidyl-dipeptidase MftE [Streptomyces sp. NRRL B-3229]|uniref:mycofactocin biosynthesis peptidyl-dipeptidase MftE n=1 Tax=Streptomyces sp. NRRL B-3229 TaxID=1463836 RepID=UPI00099C5647|nr:mycofactocin biosynthesis peptidyl-dipeptidase MftE [Streptomyces sp. NRRL B-3229]
MAPDDPLPPAGGQLAHTAWPDVPGGALVLVPIGSTEQHGPHLPLDTDTVIAGAVARAAADTLASWPGVPPLVAPALAYGASGEHAGFPGTVSIGHEALDAVLVELARSLALWAGRVVFVTGHGGNLPTLERAVAHLREEGHDVAWAGCEVPGADAHAGRTETSVMLHLARESVRLDAAVAGDTRPLASLMPQLMARGVRALSPSGVLGDPTGATAEEGRRILDTMVSAVVRRIAAGAALCASSAAPSGLVAPARRSRVCHSPAPPAGDAVDAGKADAGTQGPRR